MTASLLEQLADLPKAEADALIRTMAPGEANALEYDWRYRARPEQLPPAGSYRVWLLLAGRGFGKTRCGAEWVRAEVKAGRRRIALVAPTAADARNVMVEGASGILAISPDPERPLYEPSKRRLTWPNGAVAAPPSQQAATPPAAPSQAAPSPPPRVTSEAQIAPGRWVVDQVRCSDLLGASDEDREAAAMFIMGTWRRRPGSASSM